MKHLLSLLLIFLYSFSYSQDCGFLTNLDVGDSWSYSSYNAKDKHQGDADYEVLAKSNNNDSTIYKIQTKTTDGKDEMQVEFDMACYKGSIYMSLQRMIGPMIDKMEGMEIQVEAESLELPVNLKVGDSLNNAHINIKATVGTMNMNMSMTIKERYVARKETITTPAGEFECYVIEQKLEFTSLMGTFTTTSKEWYSLSSGMIRSESYDKKGKLDTYTVLKAISI